VAVNHDEKDEEVHPETDDRVGDWVAVSWVAVAVADGEEDEEEIHPETGDRIVAAEVAVLSHQIG